MNSNYDEDGFDVRKNSSDDIPPDDDYYDDGELVRFDDDLTDLPLEDHDTNAIFDDNDLDMPYVLPSFPTDAHYCGRCHGVIIEADYVYTGRLDYCYFCLGNIYDEEEALTAYKDDEGYTTIDIPEAPENEAQADLTDPQTGADRAL